MWDKRWLLLCAGLLPVLTPSGSRGQQAMNPGGPVRSFQGHTKAVNDIACSGRIARRQLASAGRTGARKQHRLVCT
jgi:hypothetical protein